MNLNKIKEATPGEKIGQKITKSLGIHNSTVYTYGALCRSGNVQYVLSKTNRYDPSIDDIVLGKVLSVSQEFFKVDLTSCIGILPTMSFVNASKRNRPDIQKDNWVLARIVRALPTEPLLSCEGEGFGKISGYIFSIGCWRARMLYCAKTLYEIGQSKKFKIAVGVNGYVWIEANTAVVARDVYDEIMLRLY